jgi:hypothetical protein
LYSPFLEWWQSGSCSSLVSWFWREQVISFGKYYEVCFDLSRGHVEDWPKKFISILPNSELRLEMQYPLLENCLRQTNNAEISEAKDSNGDLQWST